MKRLILFPCLLIFVALFATVTAMMQGRLRQQLNTRDLPQVALPADALPLNLTVNSAHPQQPTIAIDISPVILVFDVNDPRRNPANQTINITNTGGGTLNWTASDNAPWLTVSPGSGTAPSTLTASVDISGLREGTYFGRITISATGATNTPVIVPVTLRIRFGIIIE